MAAYAQSCDNHNQGCAVGTQKLRLQLLDF
jgi:hypothetical protein